MVYIILGLFLIKVSENKEVDTMKTKIMYSMDIYFKSICKSLWTMSANLMAGALLT